MSIDPAPINASLGPGSSSGSSRSSSSSSSRPKSRARDYDTGFPEPFCGSGNTTLRHPAANTSPDFCICSSDIDVDRVYNRSRRTFFVNNNTRTTLSHGKLSAYGSYSASTPSAGFNNNDSDLSSITEASSPPRTGSSSAGSFDSSDSSRLSKDGLDRPSLHLEPAHPVLTRQETSALPDRPRTSHSTSGGGGFLRKLRRRD